VGGGAAGGISAATNPLNTATSNPVGARALTTGTSLANRYGTNFAVDQTANAFKRPSAPANPTNPYSTTTFGGANSTFSGTSAPAGGALYQRYINGTP
jgi:hypothetical protein